MTQWLKLTDEFSTPTSVAMFPAHNHAREIFIACPHITLAIQKYIKVHFDLCTPYVSQRAYLG